MYPMNGFAETMDSEFDEFIQNQEDCEYEQYEDSSTSRPNTSLAQSLTSAFQDFHDINHYPEDAATPIHSGGNTKWLPDKPLEGRWMLSQHTSSRFAVPAPPPHLYGAFKASSDYHQSHSVHTRSTGTVISGHGKASSASIYPPKIMNFCDSSESEPYKDAVKTKRSSLMKGKKIINKILRVAILKSQDPPSVQPTGLGWQEARRDLNRSNSPSLEERDEKRQNSELEGFKVLKPIDFLEQATNNEGENGDVLGSISWLHIESIILVKNNLTLELNFSLVDKTTRCVTTWPENSTPESLATGLICRPYRNDIQRLRAIFIFLSEKITYERGMSNLGDECSIYKRVLESRRARCDEIALVLQAMCNSIDIHCEIIHGYNKTPGEGVDIGSKLTTNHAWNAVLIEGEWRIIDASLANPSHPYHKLVSNIPIAESFFFLTRPLNAVYTHLSAYPWQQHIIPPVNNEIFVSLPYMGPAYFLCSIRLVNFDTSVLLLKDFECIQIDLEVPEDVECVAEVDSRAIPTDSKERRDDTDSERKYGLSQPMWVNNTKYFRIKGVLPENRTRGVLFVYAGKKGLMHSINDNPHSLALAIPITHIGENAPYSFVPRHPTLYALRYDLYICQPQCEFLGLNNTYVFSIRQFPGSKSCTSKPVKLAFHTPGSKMMTFRHDKAKDTWEIQLKIVETGVFRGLVLSDRKSYCAFAEWKCIA